jgi:hypothetical protein
MTHRYPWPASRLTTADMAILHRVRESSRPRVSITRLIAQAIRNQYGQVALTAQPEPEPQPEERKQAA